MTYKLFGAAGSLSDTFRRFLPQLLGYHVLVRTDSTVAVAEAVVSYLNHQGGLHPHPLCRLVRCILLWAQTKFLSIKAVHVLGCLSSGADLLSRQSLEAGEWRRIAHKWPKIFKEWPRIVMFLPRSSCSQLFCCEYGPIEWKVCCCWPCSGPLRRVSRTWSTC